MRIVFTLIAVMLTAGLTAAEYSYSFSQQVYQTSGVQDLDGIKWMMETDASYFGFESRGQQIGSSKKSGKTVTFSTTDIKGTISKVLVTVCGASGINGEVTVSVGGKTFGTPYGLTTTSTEAEFTGIGEGEVKISLTQTSSKAFFIKSMKVVYTGDVEPVEEPTVLPMVNGIAAFKQLEDGTEAQLYIADEDEARVTYVYGKNAFVRDATGAICFYGFAKTPDMVYNQHIAGYIVGKKGTVGQMPVLLSTPRTNTKSLMIASPVTEDDVAPKVITASQLTAHYADWVTIHGVVMTDSVHGADATGNVKIVNSFITKQYTGMAKGQPYVVSGIVNSTVTDGDRLAPVYNVTVDREGGDGSYGIKEFFPIGELTAIQRVYDTHGLQQGSMSGAYDLMGRRLQTNGLKKGIYIVNGKKYVR